MATSAFSAQASIAEFFGEVTTFIGVTTAVGGAIGSSSYLLSTSPGRYAFNKSEHLAATLSGIKMGAAFGAYILVVDELCDSPTDNIYPILASVAALAIAANSGRSHQPKKKQSCDQETQTTPFIEELN